MELNSTEPNLMELKKAVAEWELRLDWAVQCCGWKAVARAPVMVIVTAERLVMLSRVAACSAVTVVL